LNEGEKEYSKYGLMKMAAVAVNNLNKGKVVTIDDIRFCRTSETTDLSQIDVLNYLSHPLQQDIKTGAPFKRSHFSE